MKNRYTTLLSILFLGLICMSAKSILGFCFKPDCASGGDESRELNHGAIMPDMVFLDLNNKYHDIQDVLDSGKCVVLDLFWAKCEPCWEYYQSGKLQAIQDEFGPNGTNQVTVFAIEAEGASISCLMGLGSCTYGNFLEDANYCVASETPTIASAFEIQGYPNYYMIMPDRYMYKQGSFTANSVRTILNIYADKYKQFDNNVQLMKLQTGVIADCVCQGDSLRPAVEIRNFGKNKITSVEFKVYKDTTYLHAYTWTGDLDVKASTVVALPPFVFPTKSKLYVVATTVNGEEDEEDNNNTLSRYIRNPTVLRGSGYVVHSQLNADADRWYWEFLDHDLVTLEQGGNPLVGTNGGGMFNQANPVPFHPEAYQDRILYRDTILPAKPGCHRLKVVDGLRKGIHYKIDSSYFRLYNYPPDNQGYIKVETMFKEQYVVFEVKPELIDIDKDGYPYAADCNDQDASIHPGGTELCDGVDNNCNGLVDTADPGVTGLLTLFHDADGDGFGSSSDSIRSCSPVEQYVLHGEDCDNENAGVHPNVTEIPDNGIDENCDGEDLITIFPCEAFAGRDTAICTFNNPVNVMLGGFPAVTGGVPPYTFTWSTVYHYANVHFTASDFLSDTTHGNPMLIDPVGDELIFRLDVVDSFGNVCYDSVSIQLSNWTVTPDVKISYILPGDSTQLYPGVHGGIEPLSYHWEPETGLADPFDPFTWASPDTTTVYQLSIIDSAGCIMVDQFEIQVGITDTEQPQNTWLATLVYPNPVIDKSILRIESATVKQYVVVFYSMLGQPIIQAIPEQNQVIVNREDFFPGIYFYQVYNHTNPVAAGKIIMK